ncbi:MAG: hypothetical protein JWM17_2166 [Actinobacteria bacterium]|nr:hypothetical protein [Actinomycetota bacterium]
MIRDDAEKLSTLLTERCAHQAAGVVAEVEALSSRIEFNAPGGGRPTLVRYKIRFRDEARVGHLDLDEARALLDDLDAGWGPDRIFEEITARGGAVEPAETAEK